MDCKNNFNSNITDNINRIKHVLGNSEDILIREFNVVIKNHDLKFAVLFLSSLADEKKLDDLSLELNRLINSRNIDNYMNAESFFDILKSSLLCNAKAEEGSDFETLYSQMLQGKTIILIDGYQRFLVLSTYGPKSRSISEPTSQTTIKGSKEGFTEKIEDNISLIRKRIKDKSVRIENMALGKITKTKVAVVYLEQIAKADIVKEIKTRLGKIQVDGVIDSGYLEELIKDDPYSVFPTFLDSEKPDSVSAGLLEGKVAILVDGSPFVLTAPALFMDFLQASEDYNNQFFIASMTRIFRFLSLFLTLLVPPTYVALATFHQEMIPKPFLISIAAQREGVPFPTILETLLMEVTFEILREAGVRMPRAVGSAISIVGALVLGQSAVQAGFISAVIVIIVSLTALASFAIPNYSMSNAIRLLRFILMALSATFGLFGIYIGLIILTLHLSKLKSIGVPYLTPIAPKIPNQNKDSFVRFPIWKMNYRPKAIANVNSPRIKMTKPAGSEKKEEQEPH